MSGLTGAINTALTGLKLFEAGISTVSNNLANANTPGYAAETVDAKTAAAGPGQPGLGVQAPQILRTPSGLAAAQLRTANAAGQAAAGLATTLTGLSNALTNNGDVQSALNQFFQDISTLAANPASTAQRQTILGDAQTVVSSFQNAAGGLGSVTTGATQTLSQSVASANQLLTQLGQINKNLIATPNDPSLLDQQQAALNTLSGLIGVNALPQPNGSIVLAAGGTVLLDQSGPQLIAITNSTPPTLTAGTNATPLAAGETDGVIGGSLAAIAAGNAALQSLNNFAAGFATAVNATQAAGLTPTGAQGGPLFSVPAPSVSPAAANTGTAIATAQIASTSALPTDGGPFLFTYNGATSWTAIDQSSGQSFTGNGTPPNFFGISLSLSGGPNAGDAFSVNPAPNAAAGIAAAATSPADIAAADPYAATPGTLQANGSILDSNAGSIIAGADTVSATPPSNAAIVPASVYGQSLQLTFTSPTSYSIASTTAPSTPLVTGSFSATSGGTVAVAYPSGPAAGQYWQLPISGTPATGDVLTLTPGGPDSGSNATRLAALFTAPATISGGTLQNTIIGLGTGLGANAQAAQQTATATAAQVTTATTNLQNTTGVSTDQQAVTLTQYEQAYQAAAQAISAASKMFQSLLQAV